MRSSILLFIASLLSLTYTFTPPGLFRNIPPPLDHYRELYRQRQLDTQAPMNPGPVQPPAVEQPETLPAPGDDDFVTISDILPKTRSINIFASLTRDISSVASRLEQQSSRPADNTTLLAPLNSAMQGLPRKPWEDRPGDSGLVKATKNEDKAAENLRRFVEEHVVPASPWKEGEAGKVKTLGGQELWWERKGEKRVILPGGVEVDSVVGRVGNGEIWALKGVVNYA